MNILEDVAFLGQPHFIQFLQLCRDQAIQSWTNPGDETISIQKEIKKKSRQGETLRQ